MGDGEAPADLRLAWMCGETRLPDTGGVLDQDFGRMMRMQSADNIYRALVRLRNAQGAQIHQLTDGERRIIRALMDGGYLNGG